MSTSILYHAFGLKGICYTSTHYNADAVILRAEMTDALIKYGVPICLDRICASLRWTRLAISLT